MLSVRRCQLGRKPHLWSKYGSWHCSSANAKGEGSTAKQAWAQWRLAHNRYTQRAYYRSLPPQPPLKNWP